MKRMIGNIDYLNVDTTPGSCFPGDRLNDWMKPMTLHERVSWLECNWYEGGDGPEIFMFYLNLANGYGDNTELLDSGQQGYGFYYNKVIGKDKVKIVLKVRAFVVLAKYFFTIPENDREPNYHPMLPYKRPLFGALLEFFRTRSGYGWF
jgi:hypothetical protein